MEQNKFLNEAAPNKTPEQVILIPSPRTIRINGACPERAYGLFDSETGKQIGDFLNSQNGQVEFRGLDPSRHYDVGAIENYNSDNGDEKPEFSISWTLRMKDDTDSILNSSDNLPIAFPNPYLIKDKKGQNGVFDLTDSTNNPIAQVTKLSPSGDKPKFQIAWTFKMKDDE